MMRDHSEKGKASCAGTPIWKAAGGRSKSWKNVGNGVVSRAGSAVPRGTPCETTRVPAAPMPAISCSSASFS
ncbi:hypothetical protein [Labrys miyagiensis]